MFKRIDKHSRNQKQYQADRGSHSIVREFFFKKSFWSLKSIQNFQIQHLPPSSAWSQTRHLATWSTCFNFVSLCMTMKKKCAFTVGVFTVHLLWNYNSMHKEIDKNVKVWFINLFYSLFQHIVRIKSGLIYLTFLTVLWHQVTANKFSSNSIVYPCSWKLSFKKSIIFCYGLHLSYHWSYKQLKKHLKIKHKKKEMQSNAVFM